MRIHSRMSDRCHVGVATLSRRVKLNVATASLLERIRELQNSCLAKWRAEDLQANG